MSFAVRDTKRTIAAIIFLTLVVGVIFMVTRPGEQPVASCFDGIRNQGEEDVDCGGPCQACRPEPEVLVVSDIAMIPAENRRFDVAFKITNPNLDFGASSIQYTIETKTVSGQVVEIRKGEAFIAPRLVDGTIRAAAGEKWVIEHGVRGESGGDVSVSLGDIMWEGTTETFRYPDLAVINRSYSVLPSGLEFSEAKGVVKNDSPYNFDLIEMVVLLFGEDDRLLAVRRTETRTIKSGERREFRVSWRFPIESVRSVEMIAYTNVFLNDNFIEIYGTHERFQETGR